MTKGDTKMKPMTIYVHSYIDVITNSSTECYVGANEGSVDYIKEVINGVLETAGVKDKKADDLFDIKLVTFDTSCDNECWFDEQNEKEQIYTKISEYSHDEKMERMNKYCQGCDSTPSSLHIVPKTGNSKINISLALSRVFAIEEVMC